VQLAMEEVIQTYLRKQASGEPLDLRYVADNVLQLSASLAQERDRRAEEAANLANSSG
jgi:hypothetical protein